MSDTHSQQEETNTVAASFTKENVQKSYGPTPFGKFNVNGFEGYTSHYQDPEETSNMMYPFTGNLNLGYQAVPTRKYANPVPAGILALGISLFTLSLILLRARHVTNYDIVIGPFFFLSCFIQIISGIWCIVLENTYAATILLCYGGFFGSFAAIITSGFDIASSYETTSEFDNALGYYLSAWTIFAILTWLVTFKSTLPIFALTFCVWLFFLLLTIGFFAGSEGCLKASGVFGFLSSVACYYVAYVGLASKANSYGIIPTTYLPSSQTPYNRKFWNYSV